MKLREAVWTDGYALWLWANDAVTRAGSGNRALIRWADHLGWLADRLESGDALVFIGESAEGQPVGTIRFETKDSWRSAVLSYVVAPEARGQGFGRALLVEGVATIRRRHPATRIDAIVERENVRSKRLFESLGWRLEESTDGRVRFFDRAEAAA